MNSFLAFSMPEIKMGGSCNVMSPAGSDHLFAMYSVVVQSSLWSNGSITDVLTVMGAMFLPTE